MTSRGKQFKELIYKKEILIQPGRPAVLRQWRPWKRIFSRDRNGAGCG